MTLQFIMSSGETLEEHIQTKIKEYVKDNMSISIEKNTYSNEIQVKLRLEGDIISEDYVEINNQWLSSFC